MKVLVTGGAGYIGSVTVARLLEAGHDVVVLDSLERGHRDAVADSATFVHGDIRDRELLDGALRGVDAVMNFAALSLVAESVQQPERYFLVNAEGMSVLLAAMAGNGVHRLVQSSTAAVYGEPVQTPIDESQPLTPTNPYGASKVEAERLVQEACSQGWLNAFALRYFNVGGSYGHAHERHEPETHLIPNIVTAALSESPFNLFGTDWPTDDSTAVRDYIHVLDVADAHIAALESTEHAGVQAVNLGSSTGYSVRDVIDEVSRQSGVELNTVEHPRREGDPAVLVASNAKAQALLGWTPSRTLAEIVADYLK